MKIKKTIIAVLLSSMMLTFSACGGSSESSGDVTESQTEVATETAEVTEAVTEAVNNEYSGDVYNIYEYFKQNCKDTGKYIEYTKDTDPNKTLGTPGYYNQKINFSILSIPEDISVYPGLGACIEIYDTEEGAEGKKSFYATEETEYSVYVSKNIMLRISSSADSATVTELQSLLDKFIQEPQDYTAQKTSLEKEELHPFNDVNKYKDACKAADYEEIARDSNALKGRRFTFTGQIIQVMDGEYRMNVTKSDYGFYDDTIVFTYDVGDGDRLLEDDIVTIWGNSLGLVSYTTVLGQEVTIPAIEARIVELQKEE